MAAPFEGLAKPTVLSDALLSPLRLIIKQPIASYTSSASAIVRNGSADNLSASVATKQIDSRNPKKDNNKMNLFLDLLALFFVSCRVTKFKGTRCTAPAITALPYSLPKKQLEQRGNDSTMPPFDTMPPLVYEKKSYILSEVSPPCTVATVADWQRGQCQPVLLTRGI